MQSFVFQETGDDFFEFSLNLIELFNQDYREAVKRSSSRKLEQVFQLCGQILKNLHRFLRRNREQRSLPDESDWEALRQNDFTSTKSFDVPSFMEKSEFRAKAMRVQNRD